MKAPPPPRIWTAKIRRMSKRRQKIAAQRRMKAYLLGSIADLVEQPLRPIIVDQVKERLVAALQETILPPIMQVTGSRMEGDVLHIDVLLSPAIPNVTIEQTITP